MASRKSFSLRMLFGCFERAITWLAGILVTLAILFLVYEIGIRFAFARMDMWTEEVVRLGVIVGIMLAGAAILRTAGHTRVGVLVDILHGNRRTAYELVLHILTLAALVFLCVSGVAITKTLAAQGTVSVTSLHTPDWIRYIIFPVGMGIGALFTLEKIVDDVRSLLYGGGS